MSRNQRLLIPIGFLVVLALIIYSSMGLGKISCEVCIEFNGHTSCRSAAATSADLAAETARSTACADLAGGRDESIACNRTPPKTRTCKE